MVASAPKGSVMSPTPFSEDLVCCLDPRSVVEFHPGPQQAQARYSSALVGGFSASGAYGEGKGDG
jgi:hypothetical protein